MENTLAGFVSFSTGFPDLATTRFVKNTWLIFSYFSQQKNGR
jgi:hypothetical protein